MVKEAKNCSFGTHLKGVFSRRTGFVVNIRGGVGVGRL